MYIHNDFMCIVYNLIKNNEENLRKRKIIIWILIPISNIPKEPFIYYMGNDLENVLKKLIFYGITILNRVIYFLVIINRSNIIQFTKYYIIL